MTLEQGKKLIEELKEEGLDNQEIAIVLHDKFRMGEISIEELDEIVGLVGYHLTDEFYQLSEEEQKEPLYDTISDEKIDEQYYEKLINKYNNREKECNKNKNLENKVYDLFGSFMNITKGKK